MGELNEWNDSLSGDYLWSSVSIGAPVSRAAIFAHEQGIPAVVGCGNASVILKTGDWVRVDGGRGVVEIPSDG
jgi:phosphoenolpyruvate-protein kinase (PTS system EI component)